MALFNFHYERPGPGVAADAPRKKGAARFFEVLGRDFFSFYRAGGIALICALPFALGMWFSVETHALLPLLATGLLGGALAGPGLSCLNDTILRSLRDEPGFWWQTYKKAWRQNAKASLLPGAICGLLLAMQIFTLFHLDLAEGILNGVILLLSFFFLGGLMEYIFAQIPLLDMGFTGMIKNAVLLFLGKLPRTALCVVWQGLYWGAVFLLWPLSSFVVVLCTLWLPALLAMMAVYPALNESFEIEKKIKEMRDEELGQSEK